MNLASLFCLFVLIGCVTESREQFENATASAPADAVVWNPSLHGANDIWPAGQGIVSAHVRLTAEAGRGDGAAILAMVTWNEGFVGETYRVYAGATEEDFRQAIVRAGATLSGPPEAPASLTGGSEQGGPTANAGNLSGGTSPAPPHPHI
jgi:hypothetical protein